MSNQPQPNHNENNAHQFPPPPHINVPNPNSNNQQSQFLKSDTKNFRIQGWDPILIIAQILAIQALHYLTLSIITPPLLSVFADPVALELEGGPTNVGMIMDWREMVGIGTLDESIKNHHHHLIGGWAAYTKLPSSLGRKPSAPRRTKDSSKSSAESSKPGKTRVRKDLNENKKISSLESSKSFEDGQWSEMLKDSSVKDPAADSKRGWILSISWFLSSMIGVLFLYYIVRRPIHIMDHSLTICLNHLILTTYYSSRFPSSIWFYSVLILSSIVQIVWSENLCVKREMREGLGVGWKVDHRFEGDLPNPSNKNQNQPPQINLGGSKLSLSRKTSFNNNLNSSGKVVHHYEKIPEV